MSTIGLLILQAMMLRSANAQFGGGASGGGGPSTFGYDASSACSKPFSRHGRASSEKLPCDFRRQNWCTEAGTAYPWHAVRRFVQENHGLMRRMYGDERHINILKAELEKNDIELEYDDRYQRYPEDGRRFQYEDEYEFVDHDRQQDEHQRSKSRDDESYQGRRFPSGSNQEPMTERTRKYTKSTSPTTTSATTTTMNRSSLASTTPVSESSKSTTESSSTSEGTTTPKELPIRSSSISPSIFTGNSVEHTAESIVGNNSSTSEKAASTAAAVTLADIARIKNSSINEIPEQLERVKDHSFDASQLTIASESIIEDTTLEPEATSRSPSLSTIDRIGEADDNEHFKDAGLADEAFAASENQAQQEFRPRPEYKPAEIKPENSNHKSQLFQDVAKDQQDQPVLKLRGVNACPVKEEVVAPFWANNTRGEVLALLNLYPFEQYVHWEKCTHENKQMYCRDGCRCEQQYRLHRLLAYDPNNECRGIFSDWFKFPSCCVCRCYDLPVEFRVTSRSPRLQKQKLRLRTPDHRRG